MQYKVLSSITRNPVSPSPHKLELIPLATFCKPREAALISGHCSTTFQLLELGQMLPILALNPDWVFLDMF